MKTAAVCALRLAEADLEAIGDYIARDNPARAFTFVRELRERCERIAEMPRGRRYGLSWVAVCAS